MSNFIVLDGDKAMFLPAFGACIVVVQPGTISGTGHATVGGKKVCLASDFSSVEVKNCSYIEPPYVVPGQGTLKIQSLNGDQQKAWCQSPDTVIVVGTLFNAVFDVTSPAKKPSPPNDPDTVKKKTGGKGSFINGQFFVTAV